MNTMPNTVSAPTPMRYQVESQSIFSAFPHPINHSFSLFLSLCRPVDSQMTNSIIIRPGKVPKSHNSAPLNCNILLLGDAYVGKTSLRKRLELDDFVATQATQGVELTCLLSNFQGEDLQITIWDPAGQERYAPITKTFFRYISTGTPYTAYSIHSSVPSFLDGFYPFVYP